jgi:VanZ family protein
VVNSGFWRYWAPPIIWTLATVALSGNLGSFSNTFGIFKWVISWIVTLDLKTLGPLHFYCRKVLHVMCYGILSVLWFRALMASFPERLGTNAILALGFSLLVALADEGRQYLVPGRTPSWWDIGLDLTGGILFLIMASCYWQKKKRLSFEVQPPPP